MRPADAAPGGSGPASPSPSPALLLRLLRLDARRPAAWLACGAALACGIGGATGASPLPLIVAAGGLVAVAAIGHVPDRSLAARGPLGGARLKPFVIGMRVVWPVAGFLLAAAGTAARGISVAAPLAGVLSASCTAVVFALLLRAGCAETLAASRALIGVGGAAAAALAAQLAGSGLLGQAVAAGGAGGLLAVTGVVIHATAAPAGFGAVGGTGRRRRTEAGVGPAMASALAAMVTCYFLAPQFAWAYAVVAVGWFLAVAVPPATAPTGGSAGERLRRAAAGRPAVPGSLRRAVSTAALLAGLLAWPAVVAGVLPAVEGDRVGGPLVALAWLGGVAGLLGAAVALAAPAGRAEDARAIVLSLVAVAGLVADRGGPRLPFFSGLSRSGAPVPAGNGVEPNGVFLRNSPAAAVDTVVRCWPWCLSSDRPLAPDNQCIHILPVVTISPVLGGALSCVEPKSRRSFGGSAPPSSAVWL